jgi:hypothetical protein
MMYNYFILIKQRENNMTTSTIELSQEEIALISAKREQDEAKREAEAAAEQVKLAEAKVAYEQRKTARLAESDAIMRMAKKLQEADTTNVLTFTDQPATMRDSMGDYQAANVKITFKVGERTESVDISEHIAYTSSYSYRGRNKGLKYSIWGSLSDNRTRRYTKVSSVIKFVREQVAAGQAQLDYKIERNNLKERSLAILRDKYPTATVSFEGSYSGRNRYSPDRYSVSTDNGSVTFTSTDTGKRTPASSGIEFCVYSRQIGDTIQDQVDALILG